MDHKNSHSASYAAAGVDITAGYEGVKLMSADVKRTRAFGTVYFVRTECHHIDIHTFGVKGNSPPR